MASTALDDVVIRRGGERRLYTWAAIVAALVVFAGFARSYYLKGFFGTPDLSALKHVHGLVMTTWFALFFVQARLVATGRTRIHRKLGIAGGVVAGLVVIVGAATAIVGAQHGATPGPPPLVFLAIPLGDVALFLALVSAAMLYRKRPEYHKRLMLMASIGILTAAIARIPAQFLNDGGLPAFFAATDVLVLACVAYDTIKNRRLHPAMLAGALAIFASQVARFLIAGTPQWMSFAKWLVG